MSAKNSWMYGKDAENIWRMQPLNLDTAYKLNVLLKKHQEKYTFSAKMHWMAAVSS